MKDDDRGKFIAAVLEAGVVMVGISAVLLLALVIAAMGG